MPQLFPSSRHILFPTLHCKVIQRDLCWQVRNPRDVLERLKCHKKHSKDNIYIYDQDLHAILLNSRFIKLPVGGCLAMVHSHAPPFFLALTDKLKPLPREEKTHSPTNKFKFKFIYSHLFNYDLTKMRDRKEVKNRTDYTLS